VAAFLGVQISGIPGGVVAALAIFAPSLVFVPMVGTVVRLTEAQPVVRAALDGVVVAALGLIASACVLLARIAFLGPIEVLTAIAVSRCSGAGREHSQPEQSSAHLPACWLCGRVPDSRRRFELHAVFE